MDGPLVQAAGIRKRFGQFEALAGLDLTVDRGTVCGLLGPNGAGKTTAIRVLSTLLVPDGGHATIGGHDVVRDADRVRQLIGLAGQHAALDEKLTGRENLVMFGRLAHIGERAAQRRADELLEQFDLADAGGRLVKQYSGGMRRRLDLITSLITAPPLLFLDEPTTGLDPHSRNEIWETVENLVAQGTTVLLTTQYLDEADHLADTIVVVDRGTVIADGTPDQLKSALGTRVTVALPPDRTLDEAVANARRVTAIGGAEMTEDPTAHAIGFAADATVRLPALVRELDEVGVIALDVSMHRPTLDEVFLLLTGHATVVDSETSAADSRRSTRDLAVTVTR